jgi:hypothetical protein
MNNLNYYQREMNQIAHDAGKRKGVGGGVVAWVMMLVGVIVTGTMTYALTRKGMSSSLLWRQWVNVAAFLPTILLEGSALALVYGRHNWFRSEEQRRVANAASWIIWILLAVTSVTHFAFGSTHNVTMRWLMSVYASYILPLAIVGVPMLWKKLYDSAPDSMMKVAVLEAEAALRSQLVEVEREQNALMIAAYREALETPRVNAARRELFERASIDHARTIAGFIEGETEAERSVADEDKFPNELYVEKRTPPRRENFTKKKDIAKTYMSFDFDRGKDGLKRLREALKDISFRLAGTSFKADVNPNLKECAKRDVAPDHIWIRAMRANQGTQETIHSAKAKLSILDDAVKMEPNAYRERLERFLRQNGFEI